MTERQELIALLRDAIDYAPDFTKTGLSFIERAENAITSLEAEQAQPAAPAALFTMDQFAGLVGLAREYERERAVAYKATDIRGETCHFGVKSTAVAWAKGGTVEEVRVRDFALCPPRKPTAPEPKP